MKFDLQLGDVVYHKVDDRRMVVVAYTYPNVQTIVSSGLGKPVSYKKIAKDKQVPNGIQCRLRDMHGGLGTQNFTLHEVRKPKK